VRAQTAQVAAHGGLQRERQRHEAAHEGDYLVGRQAVLPDPLDATVAQHPAGEAGDSESDGGQIGNAGFHRDHSRWAVLDKDKFQSDMTLFQGK
jgi:hypothetical protein